LLTLIGTWHSQVSNQPLDGRCDIETPLQSTSRIRVPPAELYAPKVSVWNHQCSDEGMLDRIVLHEGTVQFAHDMYIKFIVLKHKADL